MARISAKVTPSPPDVEEEAPESAPVPRKKRKKTEPRAQYLPPIEAPPPSASPVQIPDGAASWRIDSGDGRRLGAMNPEGVEVFDWPIVEFTTDNVRRRWGPGRFSVGFRDEEGKPRGRKPFVLGALRSVLVEEGGEHRAELVAPPEDPIEKGLALMGRIESIVQAKVNHGTDLMAKFLISSQENTARMFELSMVRDRQTAKQDVPMSELRGVLTQIVQRLDRLERREEELDPDPDDPDPGDDEGPLGPILLAIGKAFPDQEAFFDVAAKVAPKVVARIPDILDLISTMKARRAGAQVVVDVPEVPPPPPPVPPPPPPSPEPVTP
jgi:hypothetical protein